VIRLLLSLPILALTLSSSGALAARHDEGTSDQIAARSVMVTRSAGSARLVVSYWDSVGHLDAVTLSGAANLSNETAVLDDHEILASDATYQPLAEHEAVLLGIDGKRWVKTDVHLPFLSDPFIPDLNAFFNLVERARDVRFVRQREEGGTPTRTYSGRLGIDAFLAINPSAVEDSDKSGTTTLIQMREYFADYFAWEDGGQKLQFSVDPQDRLRRVEIVLPMEPVTVEFSDYGVGVDASAPADTQVIGSQEYENLKSNYCSDPTRWKQPRRAPCT
jgi:hypothetical protein